jgi:hypothetical protein
VPAVAVKVTALCRPQLSSLLASSWRPSTASPEYTASRVSKSLPQVSKLTSVSLVPVHSYQMELPPGLPTWSGSPGSSVAPRFEPVTMPAGPSRGWAARKASFRGSSTQRRTNEPRAGPSPLLKPSTAMRYTALAVAVMVTLLCGPHPPSLATTGASSPGPVST